PRCRSAEHGAHDSRNGRHSVLGCAHRGFSAGDELRGARPIAHRDRAGFAGRDRRCLGTRRARPQASCGPLTQASKSIRTVSSCVSKERRPARRGTAGEWVSWSKQISVWFARRSFDVWSAIRRLAAGPIPITRDHSPSVYRSHRVRLRIAVDESSEVYTRPHIHRRSPTKQAQTCAATTVAEDSQDGTAASYPGQRTAPDRPSAETRRRHSV